MDEEQVKKIVSDTLVQNQYQNSPQLYHTHNKVDSPQVDISNIKRFPSSPSIGDLVSYGGVQWNSLSAGTNAYVLTSNGTSAVPSWKVGSSGKFGGTGADGALIISSGTTTIDCSSASTLVKNYTSISITGTGKLAFSNPNDNGTLIVLKSQGNVTITSSSASVIDLTSIGGKGGVSGSSGTTTGNNGFYGNGFFTKTNLGTGCASRVSFGLGGVTVGTLSSINGKSIPLFCGAGGGSGSPSALNNSGAGGRGAGALYIECGGALNFTTGTILATGAVGGDGIQGGANDNMAGAGGGGSYLSGNNGNYSSNLSNFSGAGGGGGGGNIVIIYNTLTANSGTITVSGGLGGSQGYGWQGGTGGNGFSLVTANTEFV